MPRFVITLEGDDLPRHKDTFEGNDLPAVLLQLAQFCLGQDAQIVVGPNPRPAPKETPC